MNLAGHYWTIAPHLKDRFFTSTNNIHHLPWSQRFTDPAIGEITLTGQLSDQSNTDDLVIVIHGLGGSIDSAYMKRFVRACDAQNMSYLLLSVRGYDRKGDDLSHAALWQDIAFTLKSPALGKFKRFHLLGYSIGGHLCLHAALHIDDPRLHSVIAICPPLILKRAQSAIDRSTAWLYRHHVLNGLKEVYEKLDQRGRAPTPYAQVKKVTSIYDWDKLTVVPRHGFSSVEDYYEQASIAPRLDEIRLPCLIVSSSQDPMLPESNYPKDLSFSKSTTYLHCASGGHVAFPDSLNLGFGNRLGLENQTIAWINQLA
ncbi:MAG: alpha/beta fold hydrolase [Myxococcales bacterium]|nr:MAG: alpha/beta fold hydrolase [Myxococcales bacterium]